MPYRARIQTLTETHRMLDQQIIEMEKDPKSNPDTIAELKRKKLQYKDEIRRLEKLQWEHDYESVDFEDDR